MKVEQLAGGLWRDGYLVLEDAISHGLMADYQRLILEPFGETPELLHNEVFGV